MKKLWVYLLALAAVVLCLLPAPAHAVGMPSHSEHCVCGDTHHTDIGDHTTEKIIGDHEWQSLPDVTLNSSTGTTVELAPGNYYLTDNVTLEKTLKITGDVTICLNSYNLNCKGSPGVQIEETATLNITDCKSGGKIFQKSIGRHIVNGGTLNLYRVTLHGDKDYGGVNNCGTFKMYDGTIMECRDNAGDMGYGGVRNSGTMYMYGGSITNNQTIQDGTQYGGVWNHGEMHLAGNAQIIGNKDKDGEGSNLCTEKAIYLDGELKNNLGDPAQIELYWMSNFAVGTPVIQAGTATSYTIQDSDLDCFTLVGRNNVNGLSLALYPSANAVKLTDHINHYRCTGEHDTNAPGHSNECGGDVPFKPWDDPNSLPTEAGSYYLTGNVTLTDFNSTQINNDITLCLNGHEIKAAGNFDTIKVNGGHELTITDCKNNTGAITHADGMHGCGVNVVGTFCMYGGTITGNDKSYLNPCNVYVGDGKFYVYGGTISSSDNDAVGVYVYGGTFEMNCAIDNWPDIFNDAGGCAVAINQNNGQGGTFNLKNGDINGGGSSNGYAVMVHAGTITLDGTVRINGGLYLGSGSGGNNGKLQVTDNFTLHNSEKIKLTPGGEPVSDHFDSDQPWPQSTLNNFVRKNGKVFVQTDAANANTTIKLLTPVPIPAPEPNLTYDGTQQTGVAEGREYTVTIGSAIDAGNYTATLTLNSIYVWRMNDGSYTTENQTIPWSIAQKHPEANDFEVTGPREYEYDGLSKSVTAALASNYPDQPDTLTLTVLYTKNGVTTDTAPIDAGTYKVTLRVIGNRNFKAGTVPLGTLTIGLISQSAPTGLTGVAPTTEGGTDGKITGVNTSMEYQVESDTSWTPCTGDTITGLSAGTYQVRYREDVNHTASDAAVVTVPAYVPSLVTVRFLSGGGSGDMADVSRYPGAYTLPACGFTAPEGKEFDKWQGIDGATYAVGDTYNVTGDTELTALWKNKAVTPDPDPVTPDPDPDKPDPDPDKPDPGKPKPSRPSRPSGSGSSGPVITALPTADGLSATNYSGGIYGLTFRSSASFSSFRGVKVDGVTLDASCYTAEEGSILVYLKAAYLKTLKEGTHTLTILSTEGDTTMQFTIGAAASARTFDAGVTGYAVTALLSLGGALGLRRRRSSLI